MQKRRYGQYLKNIFFNNLKNRLVVGFILATSLTGLFATVVGITIINKSTIDEVQNKVQQDINAAELIYNYNLERIYLMVRSLAQTSNLANAIQTNHVAYLTDLHKLVRPMPEFPDLPEHIYLDMLSVTDNRGKCLYRVYNPGKKGDDLRSDPVIKKCLETKAPQLSTQEMTSNEILLENPLLADRLHIPIVPTPKSVTVQEKLLTNGMVLRVAYPVFDKKGELIGALSGGMLLNKDYFIVDKLKETVYKNETYKGRDLGYATIFLGPIRISTNVMDKENKRAIGTICSREVYEKVIGEGKDWIGRAFVVTDWYITAYKPIWDIDRKIIGILYTGVLEAKYRDLRIRTIFIFLGITLLGMCIAFGLSFYLGNTIINRIIILKRAAETIAKGNLDYQFSTDKYSGFGMLDEAFNNMTASLKDRDERLQAAYLRLALNERLAALGEMAAGVAHELNNPLGGILLYSSLTLEELPEDHPARGYVEKIIYQTNRSKQIVWNLLDFAKTPSGNMVFISINEVIKTSLGLVIDQSMFLGVKITLDLADNIPPIMCDDAKMEEVFLNLFINAADAMDGQGELKITTSFEPPESIVITVSDNGKGIDKACLPHIFDPFFTTKKPGQGSGLGLSITYGIITGHQGSIDVETEPGRGTTFKIVLPIYGNVKSNKEIGGE